MVTSFQRSFPLPFLPDASKVSAAGHAVENVIQRLHPTDTVVVVVVAVVVLAVVVAVVVVVVVVVVGVVAIISSGSSSSSSSSSGSIRLKASALIAGVGLFRVAAVTGNGSR